MYGKNRKLLKTAGRKRFSMRMTNPFKPKGHSAHFFAKEAEICVFMV